MYKEKKELSIKDWALRYGLKILNPKGFRGKRSKVWNRLYTKRQFERGIKRSHIVINTEKGLAFLEAMKGIIE